MKDESKYIKSMEKVSRNILPFDRCTMIHFIFQADAVRRRRELDAQVSIGYDTFVLRTVVQTLYTSGGVYLMVSRI